ncbi:hypothetical protein VUJ46_09750 [Chryseobacterium sp. MYb264]|uniref:hypothetical protein n=1 Tax=Chryseobacterium sp. MYb264 TaxID=2745153 RepID=UPI002E165C6E|nr:hypothetical protein VUJ46_09750 [Chryseobacterium sp. MYb264]
MKKSILAIVCVVLSIGVNAQIGMNTASPKATLDVKGITADGSRPEGLLAPRLTGNALFAASVSTPSQYGVDQDGAVVYVTTPADLSNLKGQTIHVDASGYYYFDAGLNAWMKFSSGPNIYTSDGTLTGVRNMDMNSGSMAFTNGRVGVGINSVDPSAIVQMESNNRGFLPPRMTKVQMDAITNPALGLVIYCTDFLSPGQGCLMVNDSLDPASPQWGSMCSSNASGPGTIAPSVTELKCNQRTVSGNLYNGIPVSGVTVTVPYSGGNGGVYLGAQFTSSGISGMTANLANGILNNGDGNLVFTIMGTPTATGNATFTVAIAGQSCSFQVPVGTLTANIGGLTCASASFTPALMETGSSYTGTMSVPYTGGNGVAYPQGASQTINGLTFRLRAGTLTTSSGNLIYDITGTPTAATTMTIPVSFNGSASCNVSKAVTQGTTVVIGSDTWSRYNLGADTSLDPDVPVQGIHGNYYQWGRINPVATSSTPSGAISGWDSSSTGSTAWSDTSKTGNDPCPAGFRVPTKEKWQALVNNTSQSNIGTYNWSDTNFGAAKVFTSGNSKLTFPIAGLRHALQGALADRGSRGFYWTTALGPFDHSYFIEMRSSGILFMESARAFAKPLRCIKE